jgi:hypothetical protein
LKWYELTQQPSGDWFVKLPLCDVYSRMIDAAFPELRHIGWRPATKSACYTYLKNASKAAIKRLEAFLDLLKNTWVLRLNKSIEAYFSDELDQCFALDFNFQDAEAHTYTGIGQLEYAAKYQQDKGSIDKLAELLENVCSCHPTFARVDVIASVPGSPSKAFHLPDELVKRMSKDLGRTTRISLRKRRETPQLKTLPLAKKLETLEDVFELDENVEGKSLLLVDDLYQSGSTMWTLAKFLKDRGAGQVYGLACVKSWRDSDNI